jgi:hypothetical protein
MIRPSKTGWEKQSGAEYKTSVHGYRWFLVKKGDLGKEKASGRVAWSEDGGRHYVTCPFCFVINKVDVEDNVVPGVIGLYSFIHHDRDLDSVACEACKKCGQHFWLTLLGAVPRKIWGALKLNKRKCPKCRRAAFSVTRSDNDFINNQSRCRVLYTCCETTWV